MRHHHCCAWELHIWLGLRNDLILVNSLGYYGLFSALVLVLLMRNKLRILWGSRFVNLFYL